MFLRYGLLLGASTLAIATAHAAVYTVGADGACTHTTIAAAVAAAADHPGADTINIAYNQDYTAQAITISTDQPLELVGGFATCSQLATDGSRTIIDGSGGATEPVLRITADTSATIRIGYLTIQGGDEDGSGKGGGIYFKGNGILELDHSSVTQNVAGYGGGIYAEATGDQTALAIGAEVSIVGNTARFDGGGVVNDGTQMTMSQADSYIAVNHAPNGYGGGLYVRGDHRKASTRLGSTGLGTLGAIYLNDARQGGGVALRGGADETRAAELDLFSTDPARPMHIRGNTATAEGGGIYGTGSTSLIAWYAWVDDNIAPHGAAIAGIETTSFNVPAYRPSGSADCPIGAPCGGIVGNAAIDDASQPVGGIVETDDTAVFFRMTLADNTGKFVFYGEADALLRAENVTITGNTVSDSAIAIDGPNIISVIKNTTIAGNSIGGDSLMRIRCRQGFPCQLYRSIFWQPGKITINSPDGWVDRDHILVSEQVGANPRFVDPERGDYSLRAGSPAIDDAPIDNSESFDLDLYSNPRNVDLPVVDHHFGYGPRDLGAIERQRLQPLVLNSDFDTDMRLWNTTAFGVTTWDATRNATGAQGSGSVHITQADAATGTQTGGLVQCVHLPGPGIYALNGWGHGTGTAVAGGDIAALHWEYRKSGGESCADGAPDATGTKTLSNSNNWSRPATPDDIVVTAQDWTSASSIVVTLVAVENGPSGAPTNAWFDGITLSVDGDDRIFASGFEGP